jgi:asparagine synthase (glutamine-hydrolysing)
MVIPLEEVCIYFGAAEPRVLLDSLKRALYEAVTRNVPETKVAVAFSGGVDSSVLAKISSDLGKDVTLITIGFPDSHDISFSKKIASKMGIRQEIAELEVQEFLNSLDHVRSIIECKNTSHLENCVAFMCVSSTAARLGLCTVLTANGFDELFCGYNGYRLVYAAGHSAMARLMEEKIANELSLAEEISLVAGQFEVAVRHPFLSDDFVSFAKSIPFDSKITGPDDMVRKHILRRAALEIGVPEESAAKPKKALQYGSSIHKHFKRISKQA